MVSRHSCWILWIVPVMLTVSLTAAGREVPLIEAVKASDLSGVRALLRQGADVNATELDGTTALHHAVLLDDVSAVDVLIQAGADVEARSRYATTPLALACVNGNAAMIERLLAAGADANSASPAGETALMTAARTGKPDAIRVLLAYGADVNAREAANGQTALMWAAARNNAAAIDVLIEAGSDVNAHSLGNRSTPAAAGRARAGGTAGPRPPATFSALFYAARGGHIDATRALLKGGANVNDVLSDGNTPLMTALLNAHWELASVLLDHGADATVDGLGWTPLHQLAITRRPNNHGGLTGPKSTGTKDSLDLIKQLVDKGADVNARMTKEINTGQRNKFFRIGATPFLLAAKTCDFEQMRVLHSVGADTNATNEVGDTPLMVAAGLQMWNPSEDAGTDEECLEAVKLAYEYGNDVNAVNEWNETALIGAAVRGAVPIVDFLVDKGADILVTTKRGWNAWGVANGIFYSNHIVSQPAAEARLREILTARGISTEGLVIDLSDCVGCTIGNRRVQDDQRVADKEKLDAAKKPVPQNQQN